MSQPDLKLRVLDAAALQQFDTDQARLEYARILTRPHTLMGWASIVAALVSRVLLLALFYGVYRIFFGG
jgi:hypothetical protein